MYVRVCVSVMRIERDVCMYVCMYVCMRVKRVERNVSMCMCEVALVT